MNAAPTPTERMKSGFNMVVDDDNGFIDWAMSQEAATTLYLERNPDLHTRGLRFVTMLKLHRPIVTFSGIINMQCWVPVTEAILDLLSDTTGVH
jgi:hypothetical protein